MPIWVPGLFIGATLLMLTGMALGYAANTRAALWRRRFEAERAHYADYRARSEARLTAATAAPPSITTPEPAALDIPAMAASPNDPLPLSVTPDEDALPPPTPPQARRELLRIEGIDDSIADRLEALGVTTIHDLATLTAEDELALELRLGLNAGTITRDKWCVQAALLDARNVR